MDLNTRKFQILQAIIDDYILSGTPVGSRTLSKKYNMGLSSATIRNEMSDLEELGLLDQPHISAGRVPSAKAYRLYVDSLIKNGSIHNGTPYEIKSHLSSHISRIEDLILHATQVLSELTNYTAIALMPQESVQFIRNLQLVPVTNDTALLVVVMQGGTIHNKVIKISPYLSGDTLYNISNILSEQLNGKSITEVGKILEHVMLNLNINKEFVNSLNSTMEYFFDDAKQTKLKLGGTSKLFNYPEYFSIEKAKELLSLFDTQNEIINLLRYNGEMAFTVRIGPETGIDSLSECSIITATYTSSQNAKGTIGIIGPTRMPYKQVIQILNTIGNELTSIFEENK